MWTIKGALQLIGLAVVVWLIFIAGEEYMKIQQREKEKNDQDRRV